MTPYRVIDDPAADEHDEDESCVRAEEVLLGGMVIGLGSLRVLLEIASGIAFGVEATIAAITVVVGIAIAWHATRPITPRRAADSPHRPR